MSMKAELTSPLRFGKTLLAYRKGSGQTLVQAAKEMGVSVSVVSQWERGLRFPSIKNLHCISRFTKIGASELLYPSLQGK